MSEVVAELASGGEASEGGVNRCGDGDPWVTGEAMGVQQASMTPSQR